ncbi:unnamed protein product, partial [Prorocentrum cordatum]
QALLQRQAPPGAPLLHVRPLRAVDGPPLPRTNTCIGHDNLKSFTLFVHYVPIACVHALAIHSEMLWKLARLYLGTRRGKFWSLFWKGHTLLTILVWIASLVVALLVGSLAWEMHTTLSTNITFVEELVDEKAHARRTKCLQEAKFVFPYDLGPQRNWELVMGARGFQWLLPVRPSLPGYDSFWPPVQPGSGPFDLTPSSSRRRRTGSGGAPWRGRRRASRAPTAAGAHRSGAACCAAWGAGRCAAARRAGGRGWRCGRGRSCWSASRETTGCLAAGCKMAPTRRAAGFPGSAWTWTARPSTRCRSRRSCRGGGTRRRAPRSASPASASAPAHPAPPARCGPRRAPPGCRAPSLEASHQLLGCDGRTARWSTGEAWQRPAAPPEPIPAPRGAGDAQAKDEEPGPAPSAKKEQ